MRILKTNTAVRIAVGPLISYTDGYTLKTGATATGIEANIWHEHDDGSAPSAPAIATTLTSASGGANDLTELAHGYYDLEIAAANVNFLGRAKFLLHDADVILPYFEDWLVVPANIFDSLMGTDVLDVSLTQIMGSAVNSATSQLGVNVVNWKGSAAAAMTGDAYAEAALVHAHAQTIEANLGTVDTVVDSILVDTGTTIPATITTMQGNVTSILEDTGTTLPATLAAIPAAIWNYLRSAMTTVGSIGKSLADWFGAIPAGATPFTATDLSVCNDALLLLGNNAIADMADNTKAARLCAQYYQQTVDSVLRAYTWNAAIARSAALTATTAPTFGFSYAFTLPEDCLRVLMIEDDETIPFRIEGGSLLTDEGSVMISYIKRITMDNADSLLIETISARLAATIAFSLTNSTSATEAMWNLYKSKVDEAHSVDAFEGTASQVRGSDWVNSRG